MSTSAHECPPRDAVVMTETGFQPASPCYYRIGGYEIVSSTVADLSRFRAYDYCTTAHSEQESPRGDASVMTDHPPEGRQP